MKKKFQFLMLVQTAAIVRDIHSAHGRQIAHAVLGDAMNIPEECILGDNELVDAVGEYVSW